ncbi:N-ethylammeline chlorohydrolase [Actinoalloteichus sp. AHMU CJ021]|uniref:amidohydrolase family protein n=1 Tax=Actinoalloteichus TaxID=65496 RepID=UPI0004AB357E|nr:amidohydrolase [Actinoalloteichus caeruleus]AUS80392.1 N-ethylammeline chlorohydrolase [Actinoalloteichus sp. AHMU CJ021]
MNPTPASANHSQPTPVDLVVSGGVVLTLDAEDTVLPAGAVALGEGRVVEVGEAAAVRARYPDAPVLDATGSVVLPGLVNTHTHLAMSLLRGTADDVDLQGFLARVIPLEQRLLTADNVAAGVLLALAESLRGGTTTALDMYWFHQAAAGVARRAGFRLLAGPTFMDVPDLPDGISDFGERLRLADAELAGREPDALGRPSVFAHSTYTLDEAQLRSVGALAREHGALLHVHAAENQTEVDTVLDRTGRRPVELLADLGLLGPDTVLAHAVWLTDTELDLVADSGASVAHCPVSNAKLAAGIARVPDLVARGVPVGLGTDGSACATGLNLFDVMRYGALLHSVHTGDPSAVGARSVLRMATAGGARALGLQDRLGSLEPGKLADLVVVRTDRPHTRPEHDPYSTVVYAATAADVRHTVVGGEVLVRDGHLVGIGDEEVDEAVARWGRHASSATG